MKKIFSIFLFFFLAFFIEAEEGTLIDSFCKDGQGYFEFTNGEYFGECKNSKTIHGVGTFTWSNGDIYEGDWVNGVIEGYGILTYLNGTYKYEGDFLAHKKHGLGLVTRIIADDGSYDGSSEFFIYKNGEETNEKYGCVQGRCDGYGYGEGGVYVWVEDDGTADKYSGVWDRNGRRTGEGKYWWRYKDRETSYYEGDFVDSKREGEGYMRYSDGGTYSGEYKDGQRHGKGILNWPDASGRSYEGEFVDSMRTGYGVWITKNGFETENRTFKKGETYKGFYKENYRHGIGITSFPNGVSLVELNQMGELFDGEGFCDEGNCINGRGRFVYKNGEYYEGKWKDGKRDGAGTLTNLLSETSRKSLWGNDAELCDYSMVTIQDNALICDQEMVKAEQERIAAAKRMEQQKKNERIRKERIAKEKREEQQRQDSIAKREMAKAKMDIDKISFLGVHWGMSLEEIKDEITKGAKCREIGTRKITAIECYSDSIKKEDEFVRLDLINEYIYISCGVMNACDESLEGLKQLAESGIDSRSTGIKSWESMDKLKLRTKEKIGIYLCAEGKKSGAICVTQEPDIEGKTRIGGIYLLKSFIKDTKNDSVLTTSERRIVKL